MCCSKWHNFLWLMCWDSVCSCCVPGNFPGFLRWHQVFWALAGSTTTLFPCLLQLYLKMGIVIQVPLVGEKPLDLMSREDGNCGPNAPGRREIFGHADQGRWQFCFYLLYFSLILLSPATTMSIIHNCFFVIRVMSGLLWVECFGILTLCFLNTFSILWFYQFFIAVSYHSEIPVNHNGHSIVSFQSSSIEIFFNYCFYHHHHHHHHLG